MKILNKIFGRVRVPKNVSGFTINKDEENKIVMEFDKNGEWIDILGHRITGFNGWEGFIEYLSSVKSMDLEIEKLKKEVRILKADKSYIIGYLLGNIEACKLNRFYEEGVAYPNIQERIYQDILDRVTGVKGDEDERK